MSFLCRKQVLIYARNEHFIQGQNEIHNRKLLSTLNVKTKILFISRWIEKKKKKISIKKCQTIMNKVLSVKYKHYKN